MKLIDAIKSFINRLLNKDKTQSNIQKTKEEPKSKSSAPTAPWFELAHHELGVSETKNPKRVIEYLKSTTLESNLCVPSTPWCSAFVCWCLEQAGVNSTKQAWAKSYLNFGFKTDRPNPGDIVVFSRGRASGHVAFFVSSGLFTVTVLGGNQGDQVCIKDYPKSRVLGYRTLIK